VQERCRLRGVTRSATTGNDAMHQSDTDQKAATDFAEDLGFAVLTHWDEFPQDAQRVLFETAASGHIQILNVEALGMVRVSVSRPSMRSGTFF
jgi:hypothetical protein